MTDIVDRAQEREERLRDEAIAAAGRHPHEAPRVVDGVRYCLDCGEMLGWPRLQANPDAVRCVECQQSEELRRARTAR